MNSAANMLADWQVRVIEEKDALGEKLKNLEDFLTVHHASLVNYTLQELTEQQKVMREYYSILCNRISRF